MAPIASTSASQLTPEDCTDCLSGSTLCCSAADCDEAGGIGPAAEEAFCCDAEQCPSASFVGWDWDCCTGPDAQGMLEDCPDCWTGATPPESGGEQGSFGGKAPEVMQMGDKEMEEILARCCCGIDLLPPMAPLLPPPPTFPCKWDSCSFTFDTKALLVAHVNTAHLFPEDHCLWASCAQPPPVSNPVQPVDTETLLRHLLDNHVTPMQLEPLPICHTQPHEHHAHAPVAPPPSHPIAQPHHGHAHPQHTHSTPAPRPHPHSHKHSHKSRGSHPYGVTPPLPTPSPSVTGAHSCDWEGCTLSFDTSAELMVHLGGDHVGRGKPEYECKWDGCHGKIFSQRQKVMRHLQTHTGDRPFTCDVCQKSFSEATTLTQHMRVHTNERPYSCTHPGCGKAFALASALTIHLRTHTGDRPFLCPHEGCTAAFAESSNLSKHIRTHKGLRTHTCPECNKSFARSDQLARHRRIHARDRGEISV